MKRGPAFSPTRPIRAILFDFDGVIADTEPLHYRTFAAVLADEGITITREVNDREFIGIDVVESFEKAFRLAHRTLEPEARDALIRKKSVRFQEAIPTLKLFPGAMELVAAASRRLPCAIGSGALRAEIEAVLRYHGLMDSFRFLVTADDKVRSKPAPDVYLRALELFRKRGQPDLEPEDCLVIEDSIPGIQASRLAGMRCVAVAHSHPAHMLQEADLVIPTLVEWSWESVGELSNS